MKDRSNFFKLTEEERNSLMEAGEVYIDNEGNLVNANNKEAERLKKYMEDLIPCSYGYLKNIEKDIMEQELPYVMSIEGDFGSGKTHFITRFVQYLEDKGISSIYFNALDCDILSPTIAILNVISKKGGKFEKLSKILHKLSESICSSVRVGPINYQINLGQFFQKDDMEKIKKELQKIIKEEGRMVLFVDELDRCDSRSCLELLKIIKHFFDLEGLFIILSFSPRSLKLALLKEFGSDFEEDNSENYLTKFIDHRTKIYGIDDISYKMAVLLFIKEYGHEISKKDLINISSIFEKKKLSIREIKKRVKRVMELDKSFPLRRNLELFAYISCRYDEDLNKIKDIKYIHDHYYKTQQIDYKRIVLFRNFLNRYKELQKDRKKWSNYEHIVKSFCITKYVDEAENASYGDLIDHVREYYSQICRDQGNARKLTEIFLEDLFNEIEKVLKDV